MDFWIVLPFLLCVTLAALLQSSCGFGFGIFVMMFFPFLLPSYGMSITISGMLSLVTSTVAMLKCRRHIVWKTLLIPMATFLVTSVLATVFAAGASSSLMKRLLGGALILLSIYFLFFGKSFHIRATPVTGLIAGGVSGILSGLFGMGGPPIVIYLLAGTDTKEEYSGSTQAFFIVSNFYLFIVRFLNGMVTVPVFHYFLIGVAAAAAGSLLGSLVFRKMKAAHLRTAVYIVMAVSGTTALING